MSELARRWRPPYKDADLDELEELEGFLPVESRSINERSQYVLALTSAMLQEIDWVLESTGGAASPEPKLNHLPEQELEEFLLEISQLLGRSALNLTVSGRS